MQMDCIKPPSKSTPYPVQSLLRALLAQRRPRIRVAENAQWRRPSSADVSHRNVEVPQAWDAWKPLYDHPKQKKSCMRSQTAKLCAPSTVSKENLGEGKFPLPITNKNSHHVLAADHDDSPDFVCAHVRKCELRSFNTG